MNTTSKIYFFAFNAKLVDGCDYATQTMRIVGKRDIAFALLLGEPLTWRDIYFSRNLAPWVQHKYNCILIRPLFIIPGQRYASIKWINYFINALIVRIYLSYRYPRRQKVLWFFEPWNVIPLFIALWGFTTIYDCVDYFAPLGYESHSSEQFLIRHSTLMTCVSASLAKRLREYRQDICIVPLGFAQPTPFKGTHRFFGTHKRFVVGYVGGINYRLDYTLLLRIAKALPDVHFVFVGPIQRQLIVHEESLVHNIETLFSCSNVTYVGEVSKEQAMQYMLQFSVGIIPYDTRFDFNRYSYPMKLMEYFWFGLPTIASPLFELQRFVPLVNIAENSKEFIASIKSMQRTSQTKAIRTKRQIIARANSWENKVETINALLCELDVDSL